MIKVAIINGPNLNLLGLREPEVYGTQSFEDYFKILKSKYEQLELSYSHSNIEGEIVSLIQEHGFEMDYIVLNAAAYSHTSVAIPDAVAAVPCDVIGVHISNIYQRETQRHTDLLAKYCRACLFGFGLDGYRLALDHIIYDLNAK